MPSAGRPSKLLGGVHHEDLGDAAHGSPAGPEHAADGSAGREGRSGSPAPPAASNGASEAIGRTPPRLSYMNGDVSFWRPGAPDWGAAQINTPLAPGDELYTSDHGNLELQVGGRAFVRAWTDTQIGLVNQEPDFIQLKVTSGHISLDLRSVDPGHTVEVDTPQAAFTIEAPGYYRVDVTGERTSFITRRSGRATMTPAGGQAVTIAPSEEVVLDAAAAPAVQSFVAPQLDDWDNWNYVRTDQLSTPPARATSARPSTAWTISTTTATGAWCRTTARCGCRTRSRPAGRRTARAGGSPIRTTAGRGSTPHRGAGLRTTMAAGSSWIATGRGRRARSWSGPCTRRRSSCSSAVPACRSRSAARSSAGWRWAGVSRSCRGGARRATSVVPTGPAGAGRASSTTSSSIARPWST